MSRVILRRSTIEDVRELFPKLRGEDLREIVAAGSSSYAALLEGLEAPGAECYTAVCADDGEAVAMFGAAPVALTGDSCAIWLLGSRRIDGCKFEYLRLGRRYLGYLRERFRRIYNYVDARNRKSIRLLKMLDFRFLPERNIPAGDTVFLYFEMEV